MAKRKNRNLLLFILLGLVVVLLVAVVLKSQNKETGTKVTAEEVGEKTIKEMVAASGKIFPETEIKISSDVSGEIVELFVEEGDSVQIGDLLVKIRPDNFQNALVSANQKIN